MVKELYEMARAGYIDNLEIFVSTDDSGNIAHFHIRDSNDQEKFHTCIEIENPKYFLHGNKNDILNSNQKKKLSKFMSAPVAIERYKNKFTNNWELICFLWDINNSDKQISRNTPMPDYTKLK